MTLANKSSRMKMAALCREANISRSTVYKYLKTGLLHPPIQEGPTQQKYDKTHLVRLEEIQHLRKEKKLSIPEIQRQIQPPAPKNKDEKAPPELKDLIAEKALEVFARYGFSKTKITDITEPLSLGKGTFYLYYKSKEDLFLECIKRVPESILPEHYWDEIRQEHDYFKRAKKRTSIMLKTFPTFAGIINVAKLALRGDDPNLARKAADCFRTIDRAIAKDIKHAITNAQLRQIDEEFYAFVSFGLVESIGYWLLMHPDEDAEECTDKLADFIYYGAIPRDEEENIPDTAGKVFDWKIENSDGTTLALSNVRLNNKEYLEGELGGGNLEVDLKKISRISITRKGDHYTAEVTLKTDQTAVIQIDEEITFSGESPFGKYKIPITKIVQVSNSD